MTDYSRDFPNTGFHTRVRNMILVSLFTALSAVGAFIRIPLPFVPITLQTIFVFMAGLLLGKNLGALSQLLYVVLGLMGVPLFSRGGGPGYILKPSFGYLLAFIAAAYLTGYIRESREKIGFKTSLLGVLAGTAVIYLIGLPYLYLILNRVMEVEMTFSAAVKTGMLAFLPGDLLKALLVASLVPRICRRLNPTT